MAANAGFEGKHDSRSEGRLRETGDRVDLSRVSSPPGLDKLSPQEIYELVSPSVVAMKLAENEEDGPRHRSMDLDDDLASYGSGFVYDNERKIVVTNWHVAEVQDKLLVEIGDETFPATVLGVDPRIDLAVLRIDTDRDLPPAVRIGDPLSTKVGDRVFTIGSPFGFDGTFGQGIVSGPPRTMHGPDGVMVGLVQHNAVTNPGNSGGVLINERGEVVAMNTMILSRSGGHQGFALSVPVDLIKRSVDEILSGGRIVEPSLGFTLAETKSGLAVIHVEPGSVADRAGISSQVDFKRTAFGKEKVCFDDTVFITHINGKKARRDSDLYAVLARSDDEPVHLSLRLGESGKAFEVRLTPDQTDVPDVVAIRDIMRKYAPMGPCCEHITFLSEKEKTTPGDIETLLHGTPFAMVFRKPHESVLARMNPFAKRTEPTGSAHVYVDRHEGLAVLLQSGKGIRWLEQQMQELGFEQTSQDDKTLQFQKKVNINEVPFVTIGVSMIAHGKSPGKLKNAGLLGAGPAGMLFAAPHGELPPGLADMLGIPLDARTDSDDYAR